MHTQSPATPDGFFHWKASHDAPPVALSRTVIAAIRHEVLAAFQPRGPETGGILLGSRDRQSGEFIIDGHEPVALEQAATLKARAGQAGSRFLGIYRTQMRPGLAVSASDCALVETLLPRHEGVLLLVKPLSANECVGAFFLCDGGAVVDEAATEREFPLLGEEAVAKKVPPPRRNWLRILLPVTAIAAGMGLAIFIRHQREPRAVESPVRTELAISSMKAPVIETAIGLKAALAGSLVRVSWDAASPSVQDATDGLLTVSDGDRTSSMQLPGRDLRRGNFEIKATTTNVTVQMKVNRPSATPLTEFARAVPLNDPINSSSASPVPKPLPLRAASAATGERPAIRRRPAPRRVETQLRRQPGRFRRIAGSVTSKASHLWPFHSTRQE